MAKCDEGYICEACGSDVAGITDSDLYLRFVIGMIDPEVLHTTPERHLRCNPLLAQFIDDPRFEPVAVDGDMGLAQLDPEFVKQRSELVSRGYRRLWELAENPGLSILEFPLAEFRGRSSK